LSDYEHETSLFYHFVKGVFKAKYATRASTQLAVIKKEFNRIEKLKTEPK
jgi:hypothetical protein